MTGLGAEVLRRWLAFSALYPELWVSFPRFVDYLADRLS
jgi:hypothetical protein